MYFNENSIKVPFQSKNMFIFSPLISGNCAVEPCMFQIEFVFLNKSRDPFTFRGAYKYYKGGPDLPPVLKKNPIPPFLIWLKLSAESQPKAIGWKVKQSQGKTPTHPLPSREYR